MYSLASNISTFGQDFGFWEWAILIAVGCVILGLLSQLFGRKKKR